MMNRILTKVGRTATIGLLTLTFVVLTGCASSPETSDAAASARQELQDIKNNPNLADRVPASMRQAEEAVRLAEEPLPESKAEVTQHRVYMAKQKIAIARAEAKTAYLQEQLKRRAAERSDERLASRTEEVEQAKAAKAELKKRIDDLEAESTERGIVMTLGDVLFTSGSATLQSDGYTNLNKLAAFMEEYPKRDAQIEGHTDSIGSSAANDKLSKRRAESVQTYLVRKGITEERIKTRGVGESRPIATNDTAAGRKQNRRVEIIIDESQK